MTIYKKILLILLVLPFLGVAKLNATTTTWGSTNVDGSYYHITGTFILPDNVSSINIDIPDYVDAANSFANYHSEIEIGWAYDGEAADYTDTYKLSELGNNCDTVLTENVNCRLDFLDETSPVYGYYGLVYSVKIKVLVDVNEIISNILVFFNESTVIYEYALPDITFIDWAIEEADGGDPADSYIHSDQIYIYSTTETVDMYIPNSIYHYDDPVGERAIIEFYMYTGGVPVFYKFFEENLVDYTKLGNYAGNLSINVTTLLGDNDMVFSELNTSYDYYLIITIPQTYDTEPFEYENYLSQSMYKYNSNTHYALFMNEGVVYDDVLFLDFPYEPTEPTKEGYTFTGWFTAGGFEYTFDSVITDDDLVNDIFYLYAQYTEVIPANYTVDDPEANDIASTLLEGFKLNSVFSQVILFVLIIIGIVVVISKYKLPIIVGVVAIMILTGFFMYLGILPIMISILIIGILIIMLLSYKGGV